MGTTMDGQESAPEQRPSRESMFDEAAEILVANTLGHAVLKVLARGEELNIDALLQELMKSAMADETLNSRLAYAAWKRVKAV